MREELKSIVWHGDSLETIRSFPDTARQDAGYQLERIQRGLQPLDSKPMKAVGDGVIEIRIHAVGEYRVFYLASRKEAVHVLHAFAKKTRKTAQREIDTARRRYARIGKTQ